MRSSTRLAATIAGTIALTVSSARADIAFCNKTAHSFLVAIAYQQDDSSWISRGWLNVDPAQCASFDSALKIKELYYRVESYYREGRKRFQTIWGKGDAMFAIWEKDNFNYWNAQAKPLNSTMAKFTKSPTTSTEGMSITTTIYDGEDKIPSEGGGPSR